MGILRSDRVSGLGGANAINGSVKFGNGIGQYKGYDNIVTGPSSDFTFGTGDFTLEGWFYHNHVSSEWQVLISDTLYASSGGWSLYSNAGGLQFWKAGSAVVTGGTVTANTWHHIAFSRESGSNKIFVDGALANTTNSDSTDYTDNEISIGANGVDKSGYLGSYGFSGYASNVRITKGTALYTAAFTPSTTRLEKRSDTVLLCCQSPGNVLQEATGRILSARGNAAASHFAPDLGEDHGTIFADNTKFDTLSYMVPPGGTTEQRGRTSRGVFYTGGGSSNVIDYINIQTTANATDFGDLQATYGANAGCSSNTRGIIFAGFLAPAETNAIEYITIATTGNSADFGDLTQGRRNLDGFSSQTRGIAAGGTTQTPAVKQNVIDYITIATTGDATDFGDLQNPVSSDPTGFSSPTRGIVAGGEAPSPLNNGINVIDYVTIASTGNAQDFGDLTTVQARGGGTSSNIRGVIYSGKRYPSAYSNTIDYITIATTGNAQDFGDAETAINNLAATSNCLRGVFGGGYVPGANTNAISYMSLQSSGNSLTFGDLTYARREFGACSDSHGGLS